MGLAGGFNVYQYAPTPTGWVDPLELARCPNSVLGRKVYQDDSLIDATTPINQGASIRRRSIRLASIS
nr:hypothetical protein [Burkholderia vietnamiensis]